MQGILFAVIFLSPAQVVQQVLMCISTGNIIKQLVHSSSCAPPSYGALGKFGEHSRS